MTDSQKLDLIISELSGMKTDISEIKTRLDRVEERLGRVEERLDRVEERLDRVEERLDKVEKELDNVKVELDKVKEETRRTNMVIENEIRSNIALVAEGHLDLSRNLHDAMKPSNEFEMLAVRVRVLESDMEAIKQKLA